tara:strand:- start:2872 stop:3195 length:324 start_codon:yes stop_codon:yes gene_type:complete
MKLKTWDFLKKELEDFAKENEDNFSRQQIVSHINPPKKSSGSYARMTNNTPPEPRKFMVAQKSTMEKAMEVLSAQLKKGSGTERRMASWRLKKIQTIYVKHYGGKNG